MLQTETYGDFSTALHDRFGGRRVPVEVSIEVTHRCPLDYQHCYNNLPMNDASARKQELSFAEHVRLLDELVDLGCLWLLYTGGEIFARKDFLEIYTEAKKRGFLITLFTNGTMITPRVADYLSEYRPFNIEITLYGATRETYEALTKVPGSFDRCMKGNSTSRRTWTPAEAENRSHDRQLSRSLRDEALRGKRFGCRIQVRSARESADRLLAESAVRAAHA